MKPADQSERSERIDHSELLGPHLAEALAKKGYKSLTPVQEAVLDPALADRDLRISSQTGSGKTLAIGFALRRAAAKASKAIKGVARPSALIVTPTRELAKQVEVELAWLYASSNVRVASVTGGSSFRDEQRAFSQGPGILVGTPGRLLDHLRRGSIDPENLEAVALDEADRMLDFGFREDLEAILALAPEGHRTHLISATFPREVQALAERVQNDPAYVEGTPLGSANTDIDHVVHLVASAERVNALVNLLLAEPGAQTLIFARTRADVGRIADELHRAGFSIDSLSGEMEQDSRNRALASFKRGELDALVATDVAARGIDHQDIARVIQVDPPTDADMYTHRSGRTGRAGRKGTSAILVSPAGLGRLSSLLRRAGVQFRMEPLPTAQSIASARDERLFAELTADLETASPVNEQALALARRVVAAGHAERAVARLITRSRGAGRGEPREVTVIDTSSSRKGRAANQSSEPRSRGARNTGGSQQWVPFRVSFGATHGADARRLVAMLCRRGGIRGADIGSIRVAPTFSVVEVANGVAESFEQATHEPDPRDPRVSVRRDSGDGFDAGRREAPRHEAPRREAPRRPVARHESPRREAPRHESPRPDAPKREGLRREAPRHESPRREAPRREAPRHAAPPRELGETEPSQNSVRELGGAARTDAARRDAPRRDAPRRESSRTEPARPQTAHAEGSPRAELFPKRSRPRIFQAPAPSPHRARKSRPK